MELARTNLICQGYGVRARCQTALTTRAPSLWPAGWRLWPSWKCTAEKTSRITVRLYSKDCSDTRCSCCGHRVDKESQEQSRTQQNSNILMCVVRVTITLWFENMNNYEHFPVWPKIIIISSSQHVSNTEENDLKYCNVDMRQKILGIKFCWLIKKIRINCRQNIPVSKKKETYFQHYSYSF